MFAPTPKPLPPYVNPTVDPRTMEERLFQTNQTVGNVIGGLSSLPGIPPQMRFAGDALQFLLKSGALTPTVMR